jgi:hypothetical protein
MKQERFDNAWAELVAAALQKEETPMLKEIDISYRTMSRSWCNEHDGQFLADFPLEGWFGTIAVKGRYYWQFDLPTSEGKYKRSYVGPHNDEAITARVKAHKAKKDTLRERRRMVSTLRRAGLPGPDAFGATLRRPLLMLDCSGRGPS